MGIDMILFEYLDSGVLELAHTSPQGPSVKFSGIL